MQHSTTDKGMVIQRSSIFSEIYTKLFQKVAFKSKFIMFFVENHWNGKNLNKCDKFFCLSSFAFYVIYFLSAFHPLDLPLSLCAADTFSLSFYLCFPLKLCQNTFIAYSVEFNAWNLLFNFKNNLIILFTTRSEGNYRRAHTQYKIHFSRLLLFLLKRDLFI